MPEITLTLKQQPEIDLECDCISPNNFAGKSADDIASMTVYLGNREQTLGEYFDISGASGAGKPKKAAKGAKKPAKADTGEDAGAGDVTSVTITIEGDCAAIKRVGEKMTAGEIVINGNIGMHVGSMMAGGKITVHGNAGDFAGGEMAGGELIIEGNAGNHVGGVYRGNWVGMTDGSITVQGTVGVECMAWARSSKDKGKFPKLICGGAGRLLGLHNHGGTIVVNGPCDLDVGGDMARGNIVLNGSYVRILPGFKKDPAGDEVDGSSIELPTGDALSGTYAHYLGDYAVQKKAGGNLYVLLQ
jgi:formylmethanofuran dehydrogenase subunit C